MVTGDLKKADNGTASTYGDVQEYYGKVLQTSKDLKTSACTAGTFSAAERPSRLCLDYLV